MGSGRFWPYLPVNSGNNLVSFAVDVCFTRLLSLRNSALSIAMITLQFVHRRVLMLEAAMARFQSAGRKRRDVPSHLQLLLLWWQHRRFYRRLFSRALLYSSAIAATSKPCLPSRSGYGLATTLFSISAWKRTSAHRGGAI